jgi:hypothetical protein
MLSGCSSFYDTRPSPSVQIYQSQLNLLSRETDLWKANYDKRMEEIESKHSDGSIAEAEYLILKNNLKQERDIYYQSMVQRSAMLRMQAENNIHRGY